MSEEKWNLDIDSDSGRGTEIMERDSTPNLDEAEKTSIKLPVGLKGKYGVVLNLEKKREQKRRN